METPNYHDKVLPFDWKPGEQRPVGANSVYISGDDSNELSPFFYQTSAFGMSSVSRLTLSVRRLIFCLPSLETVPDIKPQSCFTVILRCCKCYAPHNFTHTQTDL